MYTETPRQNLNRITHETHLGLAQAGQYLDTGLDPAVLNTVTQLLFVEKLTLI